MDIPSRVSSTPNNTLRAKLALVVTTLASLGCLIWVLRGAELGSLGEEIREMNWAWVALAVVADILVYFVQGWRWNLLLEPVARVPLMRSVRAIYVGLFANEILPFRSGEIIRCYLQARWSRIPFSVTLSSAVIERIFDGLWLFLCLMITLRFVELPRFLEEGATVLGVIVLAAAVLLGIVMFRKHQAHAAISGSRWRKELRVLVDDLHAMGNARSFYLAGLASLPHLLIQVVPVYALIQGYGIEDLGIGEATAVTIILRLGTAVPQAPGNLGTFQAFTVVALKLFAVESARAKRFSLVMWGAITLPLLIAGFVALAVTGLRIRELQRQAQSGAEPATESPSAN